MLLLTTIYAGESRHFYFMRGLMADRARRMAEVAALLDSTSPEIRFVLREQFNSRGFFVTFTSSRPSLSVHEDMKDVSTLMEYMLNVSLSRLYGDMPGGSGGMHGGMHGGMGRHGRMHGGDGRGDDVPRRGMLAVRELNLPSPMGILRTVGVSVFHRGQKKARPFRVSGHGRGPSARRHVGGH